MSDDISAVGAGIEPLKLTDEEWKQYAVLIESRKVLVFDPLELPKAP